MKAFCPECGYDLYGLGPVLINDYCMMGPLSGLTWRGERVKLTGFETELCWTLMKACPDPVRVDTIIERLHSEGSTGSIRVIVHRVRRKLRDMGASNPICSLPGHCGFKAYSWVLEL